MYSSNNNTNDSNMVLGATPILPTKSLPTKSCSLKPSGKFPMDLRIPPLNFKKLPESKPLKSRILVGRLGARPSL